MPARKRHSNKQGHWKLMLPQSYRTLKAGPVAKNGKPSAYEQRRLDRAELYDLSRDIGETTDVSRAHPEIVQSLLKIAESARQELGDSLTNRTGRGVRPAGQLVETAK